MLDIAKKMPDYYFIIIGPHSANPYLDNVFFIGKTESQKELAKYYSLANCFICTSVCETYPTVCLEAASCGCNIVVFDCDLLTNYNNLHIILHYHLYT